MGQTVTSLIQPFNRGLLSPLGLARLDLKRTSVSAEIQTNFMPRFLGSMMLRPGLEYIDNTYNNLNALNIPFIYQADDTAIIELTNNMMRIRVDEEIVTRPAVTTTIINGTFNGSVAGWANLSEAGAGFSWVTGNYLGLLGTGTDKAIAQQEVVVSSANIGIEHGVTIVINQGPCYVRIGSISGADDYVEEYMIRPGIVSLAFTPTGNFYVQVYSSLQYEVLVSSITIDAPGPLMISAPWLVTDFQNIRYAQSADVVFLTCIGHPAQRIERTSVHGWGIVNFEALHGPFQVINTTSTTLAPGALTGNTTLTSSFPFFVKDHDAVLFRITSIGQNVSQLVSGNGQWTNPVLVTGVGATRALNIAITGTWTGTIVLQQSIGDQVSWQDTTTTYTGNTTTTFNDGFDNQIIYYRLGFDTGHVSGSALASLSFPSGGLTGIAKVTSYLSPTQVLVKIIVPLGSLIPSTLWSEGAWSTVNGYPSALTFFENRLWFAGLDNIWGSVSDDFENFNDETLGDSGPIISSLGSGPVDTINWLLPLQRMIIGTDLDERSCRSDSLDTPLTAGNFNFKTPSTRGSTSASPIIVDNAGLFVRNDRLFMMNYQGIYAAIDYTSQDMTILCPEVGSSGFVKIVVQRYPDTRLHCMRNDGTVAVLLYDALEDIKGWVLVQTDGLVRDIVVLPGIDDAIEDRVYYQVKRQINGQTVHYLERWAQESDCIGGIVNMQADAFIQFNNGTPNHTITGLGALEGQTVIVWADGNCIGLDENGNPGTYVVDSAQIVCPVAVTQGVVGIGYTGQYQSSKLEPEIPGGSALTQKKRVAGLGLVMQNTHAQGLKYGDSFDSLDNLPLYEAGAPVDPNYIWPTYDFDTFEFASDYESDPRICLQAQAPLPVTLLGMVYSIEINAK